MTKSEMLAAFTLEGEPPKRAFRRVAAMLHITPQAVYSWPERLRGPRLFAVQCAIEVLTDGRLRADPDDLASARGASKNAKRNLAALGAPDSQGCDA